MVGDTKQDILCAKNAGVPAVLAEPERGYSKGNCVGESTCRITVWKPRDS